MGEALWIVIISVVWLRGYAGYGFRWNGMYFSCRLNDILQVAFKICYSNSKEPLIQEYTTHDFSIFLIITLEWPQMLGAECKAAQMLYEMSKKCVET